MIRYLSLFSGVEAAHIALAPLGWECAAVAEVDRDACAVLAHRLGATGPRYLPDGAGLDPNPFDPKRYARIAWGDRLQNLGDVSQVTEADIAALGRIDVLIGGSPCQDLSVAGKRAGLEGARSGLFHEQLRIFHAARHLCGARWLWWENVPGALSSNAGRDFAVVVGAMAGCELDVPANGWGSEGVALGEHGLVEWSVLDAQWFGLAQRRKRVFAVLDTGNWADRPPVLLEPDRLRGDSAPSREAGEGVTGTLSARTQGGGGLGTDFEVGGGLIGCLAHGQGGAEITAGERRTTLTCNHEAPIMVAHTLRAEGFDASEDGTGRGTPLVPVSVALRGREGGGQIEVGGDVAFTLRASQGGADKPHVLAFSCKDHGADVGDIAPTLRSMGHDGSHANAGGQVAVHTGMQVRRLTPRECERLQGFPDDWTLVPVGKKQAADGPRYKQMGNSFAVTCIRWIGRQIQRAASYSLERAA